MTSEFNDGMKHIKDLIHKSDTLIRPFFIGRIAGVELLTAYDYFNQNTLDLPQDLKQLENNAGIHIKNTASLELYINCLLNSYKSCSLIATWPSNGTVFNETGQGQQLVLQENPHIKRISARCLEPYYAEDNELSWMPQLKGKTLLIIHPFADTFAKQITRLDKLFKDKNWFKDCKFIFKKPPVTLAGNHGNTDWKDTLEAFLKELKELNDESDCPPFDLALVACGGYGMLVSEFIYKSMNRSVIYVGGALQLFFGVIGKRWFDNREVMALVNDYWVRPNKSEKPSNFTNVEKGCYW